MEICYRQLCRDDNDLSAITLFLLNELLDLGESFKSEDDPNYFCIAIARMGELRNEVSKKSYSEHSEISSLSIEIINFLEEN